eukprot:c7233_g1_i1 orf=206-412(+)
MTPPFYIATMPLVALRSQIFSVSYPYLYLVFNFILGSTGRGSHQISGCRIRPRPVVQNQTKTCSDLIA